MFKTPSQLMNVDMNIKFVLKNLSLINITMNTKSIYERYNK